MADKAHGHHDFDDPRAFPTAGSAHEDDLEGLTPDGALGELFGDEDTIQFDDYVEEPALVTDFGAGEELEALDDFDEGALDAFFDRQADDESALSDLRSELLDESLLEGDGFEADAAEDPAEDWSEGEQDFDVAPDQALGELFAGAAESEDAPASGDDAWALDQVVEEGMSWLMELGEGEGAIESSDGEGEDWESFADAGAPAGRGRKSLVGLLLVALLAGGGWYAYQEYLAPAGPEIPEVASVPPRRAPSAGGAAPEVAAVTDPGVTPDPAPEGTGEPTGGPEAVATTDPLAPESTGAGGLEPGAPDAGLRAPGGPLAALRDALQALTRSGQALTGPTGLPFAVAHFEADGPLQPAEPETGDGPAVAAGESPDGPVVVSVEGPSGAGRESRDQQLGPEDLVVMPEADMPYRLATAEDLRGIWPGSAIPEQFIDGDTRLLTPGVGTVRVVLNSGEVFDGRLYAVGEKKVWIEMSAGRMALISWQIERIDHILNANGTLGSGAIGPEALAGLERVRVRTAGGVFYGKLLNQDGDRVTLITQEGARITLTRATVEPAGRSRTRVVDASAVDASALETDPKALDAGAPGAAPRRSRDRR